MARLNSTHAPNAKIIVGLSGGVDSSVSALLLQRAGFQVEGLFMKNWQDDDAACPAARDLEDAQRVCDRLQLPLHTVNFSQEYWHHVFEIFLQEYAAGRTPNPDILCNKEIKFKAFLNYAKTLGAEKIATGHYAQCERNTQGMMELRCAQDIGKDQTYFLYTLGQAQLQQVLFPIGKLLKHHVRQLAKEADLITHNKKDSTGICFIGERQFQTFLNRYLPAKPGLIKSLAGKVLGEHPGVMYFTRGQRQGLKIGGVQASLEKPWYVADKDISDNVLYVVQGADHPALFQTQLTCIDNHWVEAIPEQFAQTGQTGEVGGTGQTLKCTAKIRYRQPPQAAEIALQPSGNYTVQFEQAQWAIMPGQSIVFYQGERCLGGGIIKDYE